MDISTGIDLAVRNLTSVPVLAFVLGLLAIALVRTELKLPDPVYRGISVYLLLAIGLKGGVALRESGVLAVALPASAAVALGLLIPLGAFLLLGLITRLGALDRGAMAAHYGSTSLVTFTAALTLIETLELPLEGHVATLVVIMEVPGIIVGLALAQRARMRAAASVAVHTSPTRSYGSLVVDERSPDAQPTSTMATAVREAITGPSVLLMVGGLVVGYAAGTAGYESVAPVFSGLFTGVLALFLLHLGVVAGGRLREVRQAGPGLLLFALLFPLMVGSAGVLAGAVIGMSTGGAAVLGVLCASASYIAAPAAVGLALPEADAGLCLTSSLALTFPFNLLVGIPVLTSLSMVVIPI